MYDKLFSSININNVSIKNRVVMPPMDTMYALSGGEVSRREIEYFTARAKGGCGLITVAMAACPPELGGSAYPCETQLFTLEHRMALEMLVNKVHDYNCKLFVQLHHPGRETSAEANHGKQPVSSTSVPKNYSISAPAHELSQDEIKEIEKAYARSAEHAYKAGADGVQLQCGHSDLISQFFSPAKNDRTDEYGGCFENRIRFAEEIVAEIRKVVPKSFPVGIRVNGDDSEGLVGECHKEENAQFAKYMCEKGVDFVHLSMGAAKCIGMPEAKPEDRYETYKYIKDQLSVPVICVGEIRMPDDAEKMLEADVADLVAVGRGQLADSAWANKAKAGLIDDIRPCMGCNKCVTCSFLGTPLRCSSNPVTSREMDETPVIHGEGTVVVIGAGPGGMMAALTAADRGFDVELFEKSCEFGGQFQLANKAPNKHLIDRFIDFSKRQIEKRSNITVHLNTEINSSSIEDIKKLNPYAVILATGGNPIVPKAIPGVENAVTSAEVLSGKVSVEGKNVVVVGGGMTGIETALYLSVRNNKVAICEMLPVLSPESYILDVVKDTIAITETYGGRIYTSHMLKSISENSVTMKNLDSGADITIPTDLVVLSMGVVSNNSLYGKLSENFERVIKIGDARNPGDSGDASRGGYHSIKYI